MTRRYRSFWNGVKLRTSLYRIMFFDTAWDGWTESRERDIRSGYPPNRRHVVIVRPARGSARYVIIGIASCGNGVLLTRRRRACPFRNTKN